MNYWMTGPCDLPEVEIPLFEMMNKMREPGRITAKKMYGVNGVTAHHNTDGFFDTVPFLDRSTGLIRAIDACGNIAGTGVYNGFPLAGKDAYILLLKIVRQRGLYLRYGF